MVNTPKSFTYIISALTIFLIISCGSREKYDKNIDSTAIAYSSTQNLIFLPFRITGTSSKTSQRGHANSPFGTIGKNNFSFKGSIQINSQKYRITSNGLPLIATELKGKEYLLTNANYNETEFKWYVVEHGKLEQINPINISKSLHEIIFYDQIKLFNYRLWSLNQIFTVKIKWGGGYKSPHLPTTIVSYVLQTT
jgi:hypothetical protein